MRNRVMEISILSWGSSSGWKTRVFFILLKKNLFFKVSRESNITRNLTFITKKKTSSKNCSYDLRYPIHKSPRFNVSGCITDMHGLNTKKLDKIFMYEYQYVIFFIEMPPLLLIMKLIKKKIILYYIYFQCFLYS